MKSFGLSIRAFTSANRSMLISIDSRFQNFSTSINFLSQDFREFTFINDDILFSIESFINSESFINQSAQSEKRVKLKQSKVTLFVRIVCQYKHQYLFHEKQRNAFYSIVAVEFSKKSDRNLAKNIVRTKLQKFAKSRKHELVIQRSDIA